MISIKNFKLRKVDKELFSSKLYKNVSGIIVIVWVLFALLYAFRDNLYKIDNQYITLFAETAPNLFASILFNLIGIFYIAPFIIDVDSINKNIFIGAINILNIITFALVEYVHVILNLGTWDNNDIIASLIGMVLSTVIYFSS